MNKRFRFFVAAGLIAPLLLAPAVIAQEAATSTTNNTDTTTTNSSTDKSNTTKKTLKERIQEHKDKLKITLTALEQDSIKLKCKPSQAVVSKLNEKVGKNGPARVKAYQELQGHLTKIIAKLKEKGVDTTTLEKEKTTLASKIAQISTDFTTYKQDLSDLKDMDCASDPTGFKATLEAARTDHASLVQEIADIKAYVAKTIKPTLVDLRKQVEDKSKTESNQ